MSDWQVLNADVISEKAKWLELFARWDRSEVSAHPDYLRLFASGTESVICLFYGDESDFALFPLIFRPLSTLAWVGERNDWCDLVSPYGYGGPFVQGSPDQDKFWDAFEDWARSQKVVSLFVRLGLFPDQLLPFRGEVEYKYDNVVVPLTSSLDTLWREFDHKVRKNVTRAKNENLRVITDPDGRYLNEFLDIYYGTMERRSASEGYYFPREFFSDLVTNLSGGIRFFHVLDVDRIISTELVLVSAEHIYSFLGGTHSDAFAKRPNDLLKYAIIEWGIENQKKAFVLGGGYEPDDGIFRYKRSFSPKGILPFNVAKRIFDQNRYDQLIEMHRCFESTAGHEWMPSPGYFPLYRG